MPPQYIKIGISRELTNIRIPGKIKKTENQKHKINLLPYCLDI